MATPIVINNFPTGVSQSQVAGFPRMQGLDISSFPGVIRPNLILEKTSSTTVVNNPTWSARDPVSGNLYVLDAGNKVYRSTDSGSSWTDVTTINATTRTTSSGAGQGMAIWKDYLFAFRNTAVDVLGPLSGTPTWTNGWGGLTLTTDSAYHPALVGQDDILYIGAGRYISSVQEVVAATFDPANGATYTATAAALDLPSQYRVRCLAELGVSLMIGTWMGANIFDFKVADIFPWDRSSSSFDIPLRLAENGVSQMVNKDNVLYIQAGTSGKLFSTNGSSVKFLIKVPEYISNLDGGIYLEPRPGAMMVHQGKIYFGISRGTSGSTAGAEGVWSYDPDTNALNFENVISTGNATRNVTIGALYSVTRELYICGWGDLTGAVMGIDQLNTSSRAQTSPLESQAYRVGTMDEPATYQSIYCELAQPLASSESVVIYARSGRSDSYGTAIATFNTTGVQSFKFNASLKTKDTIQFKVELVGKASATSGPELLEIIVK